MFKIAEFIPVSKYERHFTLKSSFDVDHYGKSLEDFKNKRSKAFEGLLEMVEPLTAFKYFESPEHIGFSIHFVLDCLALSCHFSS